MAHTTSNGISIYFHSMRRINNSKLLLIGSQSCVNLLPSHRDVMTGALLIVLCICFNRIRHGSGVSSLFQVAPTLSAYTRNAERPSAVIVKTLNYHRNEPETWEHTAAHAYMAANQLNNCCSLSLVCCIEIHPMYHPLQPL